MYRYSRPQPGRFREFFQVGAEAIGTDLPEQDAEVIDVMMQILRELGLTGLRVEVNSLGTAASRAAYVEVLRRELGDAASPGESIAPLCETCQARVPKNPLRIFDCKNEACRRIAERLPKLSGFLSAEDRVHFDTVRGALDALGIDHVQNDLLVRGLDYYTRTAFEVHYAPLGSQSALGGGGRYDGLIEACGGPPTPAVGFSAGIERILYALQDSAAAPPAAADAAVVVLPLGASARVEALRLARRLRSVAAARVDLTGRSLKAQLRTAGRDARVAVILGDHELQKREASVRDLVRGEQRSVGLDELLDVVKRTLATTAGRSPE
jgi:histidyl-tRNA synthetase